jgi:predicted transcriptional regulator
MPPKLTDSETMAFRITLRVIREFRILSDKTERTIAWHVRKALAQYLEREKSAK